MHWHPFDASCMSTCVEIGLALSWLVFVIPEFGSSHSFDGHRVLDVWWFSFSHSVDSWTAFPWLFHTCFMRTSFFLSAVHHLMPWWMGAHLVWSMILRLHSARCRHLCVESKGMLAGVIDLLQFHLLVMLVSRNLPHLFHHTYWIVGLMVGSLLDTDHHPFFQLLVLH